MKTYEPPFVLTNEIMNIVSNIMEKIGKINVFNELDKLPVLRKQNRIRSIHSSCAIEANSLSLDQVSDVINGKAVFGSQKDIIEVKNVIKAYDFIESINPYSKKDLLKIHNIIGAGVVNNAGSFRIGNEGVKDENDNIVFIAPPPYLVDGLMSDLFTWLKKNKDSINPLIMSSIFHYEFVFIHPFADGNGRMARLWQTLILSNWKSVFKYIPIESQIENYQEEYYNAISVCHKKGDSTYFLEFMLDMINRSIDEILNQNYVDNNLSEYVKKLLNVMKPEIAYTSNRLLELLNLKSKEALRRNYLKPALQLNLIKMEIPDKPTSRNQRYRLKIED